MDLIRSRYEPSSLRHSLLSFHCAQFYELYRRARRRRGSASFGIDSLVTLNELEPSVSRAKKTRMFRAREAAVHVCVCVRIAPAKPRGRLCRSARIAISRCQRVRRYTRRSRLRCGGCYSLLQFKSRTDAARYSDTRAARFYVGKRETSSRAAYCRASTFQVGNMRASHIAAD